MFLLLRLEVLEAYALVFVTAFWAWVAAAIALRGFHLVRGRRDRDAGFPCVHCRRVAFPVEGSTTRYRCWNCGSRFEGLEHL
jgi:hypothetical protein